MTIAIKPTASGSTIEQNGSTILTVDGSGNITPSNQMYPKVPAFSAYLSSDQSISSGVYTKVACDTEDFDTTSDYDTTNYRYTPSVAGYYQVNGSVRSNTTSQTLFIGAYYKNGSGYRIGFVSRDATSATNTLNMSDLIYMNGSTDYLEFYAYISGTSPVFDYLTDDNTCFFNAHLVSV